MKQLDMYRKAYELELYACKIIDKGVERMFEIPDALALNDLGLAEPEPTDWQFNEPDDPSSGAYAVDKKGAPTGARAEFY